MSNHHGERAIVLEGPALLPFPTDAPMDDNSSSFLTYTCPSVMPHMVHASWAGHAKNAAAKLRRILRRTQYSM